MPRGTTEKTLDQLELGKGHRQSPIEMRRASSERQERLSARRADFGCPRGGGKLVEHAIDELVAVSAPVYLGQFDRLVDRNAIGHVRLAQELPCADHQDTLLDRRELRGCAITER